MDTDDKRRPDWRLGEMSEWEKEYFLARLVKDAEALNSAPVRHIEFCGPDPEKVEAQYRKLLGIE